MCNQDKWQSIIRARHCNLTRKRKQKSMSSHFSLIYFFSANRFLNHCFFLIENAYIILKCGWKVSFWSIPSLYQFKWPLFKLTWKIFTINLKTQPITLLPRCLTKNIFPHILLSCITDRNNVMLTRLREWQGEEIKAVWSSYLGIRDSMK